MTGEFATLDGRPVTAVAVHVPFVGPWWADVDMVDEVEVSGQVDLVLGTRSFRGSVASRFNGTFLLQRRVRLVAGNGSWGLPVAAKAYHNDAGVRAMIVVQDVAREVGEVLGSTFAPAVDRVGNDYVRQAGLASRVLEDMIGGVPWWVDLDGEVQVGAHPSTTAASGAYEVLDFDPRARLLTLAVDDPGAIQVGMTLSEGLDAPMIVREVEILVDAGPVRVKAWCGESGPGRLAGALQRIIDRRSDLRLFGHWKYRVSAMSGDRVQLQAVSPTAGLPDILPVSMWPGAAGVHAELTPGAVVLVEFIEGRRTDPMITHFAGKDGTGFVPVSILLDATALIKLGANATGFLALALETKSRLDTLQTAHDTHTHLTAGTGTPSVPTVLVGPLGPIATVKVKAE